METIDYAGQRIGKWQVGASTYLAWPEAGARLMNWHVSLADGSVRDVIHWPEQADYSRPAKIRGGNPILFPFAGRTFENGDIGYWRTPEGERRPMQMHGYARDGKFKLTHHSPAGFIATFEPSAACREAYPYDYEFSVHYRFSELAFWVDLVLTNHDRRPIPWCPGHHFYFQLPWHAHLSRGDYEIDVPAKKAFYHAGDGRLEPTKDFLTKTTFADFALVDRIHCRLKRNSVTFGPKSEEENVTIRIGSDPVPSPWVSLVTWTETPDSPFYCVEPWMGPPNSPENKNGMHFVDPGKTGTFSVEVSLM